MGLPWFPSTVADQGSAWAQVHQTPSERMAMWTIEVGVRERKWRLVFQKCLQNPKGEWPKPPGKPLTLSSLKVRRHLHFNNPGRAWAPRSSLRLDPTESTGSSKGHQALRLSCDQGWVQTWRWWLLSTGHLAEASLATSRGSGRRAPHASLTPSLGDLPACN